MMRHRPGSGEYAVFSRLARITAACCRNSSIGYGWTGEADDDDNCEAEAFGSKQLRDLRRQGLCNVTSMGASDGAMKRSIEYQGRQLKRLRNNGTKRKSETFNEKPSTVEDDRDSFAAGSMVASLGEKIVSTCNTTKRRAGSAQHFCS